MPPKRKIRVFTEETEATTLSTPVITAPEEQPTVAQSDVAPSVYRVIEGVVLYSWQPYRVKHRGAILTSDEFAPPPGMTVAELEKLYLDLKWIELWDSSTATF